MGFFQRGYEIKKVYSPIFVSINIAILSFWGKTTSLKVMILREILQG